MNIKDFIIGDVAFILNMYKGYNREPSITKTTVKSIGRKYLTTENEQKYVSSNNLYGLQEQDNATLLCPSTADAIFYIEKRNLEKWLGKISVYDARKYTLEQLRQVKRILSRTED